MTTIFDAIIEGTATAEIIWDDSDAVAFLDQRPRTDGHTLVVPRREVAHWIDLTDEEDSHLFWVAKQIGRAQVEAFDAERVGLVIAGYHVAHVHLHVFPTTAPAQLDFRTLPDLASPNTLKSDGDRLRHALRRNGFAEHVPAPD